MAQGITPEQARQLQRDPCLFASQFLGVDWWPMQKVIAENVRDNSRIAVKACHSSGKTKVASDIALWWLATHPESVIISTAPTNRQVTELLWREMRDGYNTAARRGFPLGGRFYDVPEWSIDEKWYALGLSTKDPNSFQGHHSSYMLVIVDEAPGVAEPIFEAIEGVLSTANAKLLLLGNPTSMSGAFHSAFHAERSRYCCMSIPADITPNFDTVQPRRPYLITPEWSEGVRQKYGEDSPFYQSRVMAEFPRQGTDTLIPLQLVEDAVARWQDMEEGVPCEMGVDVARYGDDETVFVVRRGAKVCHIASFRGYDTMRTVGEAIRLQRQFIVHDIKVDSVGIGAGVYDRLAEQSFHAVQIESAEAARDKEQYANRRAEMWAGLKHRLQDGDIALPPDESLVAQLVSVKYKYNSRGQLVIESKEDMAKRGIESPDRADAVVYAFADVRSTPLDAVQPEQYDSRWAKDEREEGRSRWR